MIDDQIFDQYDRSEDEDRICNREERHKEQYSLLPILEAGNEVSISTWDAVDWFYSRPWFTRVWIFQEVAFAPAIVYIRNTQIDWIRVCFAAKFFMKHGYTSTKLDSVHIYGRAMTISRARSFASRSFGLLLGLLNAKATDSRDKVYALLGLAKEKVYASPSMQPDYTKSVPQVYMDTIRHVLKVDDLSSSFPPSILGS